ncbi:hypothetical protein ABIB94_006827 [Bradyrhizobium sp. JR7.2]
MSTNRRAKIVDAKEGIYGATIENTGIRQRDKLEEAIVNLATVLGAKIIKRGFTARGSYIYSVDEYPYQSASNTILHLSRKIAGISA